MKAAGPRLVNRQSAQARRGGGREDVKPITLPWGRHVARHHHAHVIQCHRSWLPAPQTPRQDEDAGNKCWQGACLPSGGIKHRCTAAIRLAGTQTAPASARTTVPVTGGQDLAGKLFEAAGPGRDGRSASVEPPRQRAHLIQSLVRFQDDKITGKDAMVLMGWRIT